MEESWSKMYNQGKRKYQMINVLARRARQLNEGDRPQVPSDGTDHIRTAVAELKADKLRIQLGKKEETDEDEG